MSFLNKVFREILKIKPFFQSLGRFRLGVGVSFSADTPVTGLFYSFRMLSRFLRIAFPLHSRVEKSIPMVQVSRAMPQTCSPMRFFGKKGAL